MPGIGMPDCVRRAFESGLAVGDRLSSNFTPEKSPAKLGSSNRIRSSSGGCVAVKENHDSLIPLPKNIWLASSACGVSNREPVAIAPIFFSAPAKPSGLRVNCTADESARYSRCRDTALLMRLPMRMPKPPAAMMPSPAMPMTAPPPPSSRFLLLRLPDELNPI